MGNSSSQNWMLLGTAETSNKVWGIKKINFPCGYHLPNSAFVGENKSLILDFNLENYWVLGGLAIEINKTGKNIETENALGFVRGYRPWISIYKNQLIEQLKDRRHNIMIWDQGVSIFYGLWRDNSHKLGDLIDINKFEKCKTLNSSLKIDSQKSVEGEAPEAYIHESRGIVNFMSRFMTISNYDIYILGPIVAQKISNHIENINLEILNTKFNVNVQSK